MSPGHISLSQTFCPLLKKDWVNITRPHDTCLLGYHLLYEWWKCLYPSINFAVWLSWSLVSSEWTGNYLGRRFHKEWSKFEGKICTLQERLFTLISDICLSCVWEQSDTSLGNDLSFGMVSFLIIFQLKTPNQSIVHPSHHQDFCTYSISTQILSWLFFLLSGI